MPVDDRILPPLGALVRVIAQLKRTWVEDGVRNRTSLNPRGQWEYRPVALSSAHDGLFVGVRYKRTGFSSYTGDSTEFVQTGVVPVALVTRGLYREPYMVAIDAMEVIDDDIIASNACTCESMWNAHAGEQCDTCGAIVL